MVQGLSHPITFWEPKRILPNLHSIFSTTWNPKPQQLKNILLKESKHHQLKPVVKILPSSIKSICYILGNFPEFTFHNLLWISQCAWAHLSIVSSLKTLLSKYPPPLLPSLTLQSLCLRRHHCLLSVLQKVIHSLIITVSEEMMIW